MCGEEVEGLFYFLEFIFTSQHKGKHSFELHRAHIWMEI